jgi:hypothetical protein
VESYGSFNILMKRVEALSRNEALASVYACDDDALGPRPLFYP